MSEIPAVGRVLSVADDSVVFLPLNTNYELKLLTSSKFDGVVGQRVEALIRVVAKKILTVTSGGNFIAPIFGPPRTIQGRIKSLDEKTMVVQAGAPVIVELPEMERGYDMECGPLAVGSLVNVLAMPGATVQFVAAEAVM